MCPESITDFCESSVKAKLSSSGALRFTLRLALLGHRTYWVIKMGLLSVTLSGKKSEQQRRRRKEKNELPSDGENDSDNELDKQEKCEFEDNGAEKVGDFHLLCIKILFTTSCS